MVAITVWRDRLAHRCVIARSDNESVVACINSQTSRSRHMMQWLRQMFVTVVLDNILVRAVHISGHANGASDALSRGLVLEFRRLRPAADPLPTAWRWEEFPVVLHRG